MDTRGRHLLIDFWGCDPAVLDDLSRLESLLERAAVAAGATVVGAIFHPFSPQGVTGVVVLQESHLSIHTWPEQGYAAVDFYSCGSCDPDRAQEVLTEALKPMRTERSLVERGRVPERAGAMLH